MDENRITYFAETDARNKRVKFGIKNKDRSKHVYVIGKTGMGKSTMLENMAVQDIQNGEGICFIDPHGKTADLLLEYVPQERIRDVIYIAPFDTEHPISFNVLESVDPDKKHLVASGLMSTFKKIWVDAWSARMEYILTNTLLALLDVPGSTLLGVNKMLSDKEYRKDIVSKIKDPSVKAFWVKEFANYTERMAAESVPAIQNKVGQFTANPLIRNMIGQPQSSFDFRQAMDTKKIVIINLSKGRIGDENMKLLGGMLVTKIYLAAMSRADMPDRVVKMMPNFYLYVDEFQNFANASFADILSEARKYKLNLTIAHQYIEQMDEEVAAAVFGNVGTMITFRVGATDAEYLEKEFTPEFVIEDLVNLGFTQIYLKLMIDGLTSTPFSGTTLPPIPHPEVSYMKDIVEASREQFARPRADVEKEIVEFHDPVKKVVVPVAGAIAGTVSPTSPTTFPRDESQHAVKSRVNVSAKSRDSSRTNTATPSTVSNIPKQVTSSVVIPKVPATSAVPVVSVPPVSLVPHAPSTSSVASKSSITSVAPAVSATPISIPKPISLSALVHNNQTIKHDPKKQSPAHVNDLKSALQAVLGKQGQQQKSAPVPVSVPALVTAPSSVKKPNPVSTPIHKTTVAPEPKPIQGNDKPKEVSEDVLKKVLRVE